MYILSGKAKMAINSNYNPYENWNEFPESFDKTFCIAHQDAESLIKIPERRLKRSHGKTGESFHSEKGK